MEIIYAAAGGSAQGGGLAMYFPFILIMFVIYFFMIRPQAKKQKEKQAMLDALQKGDKVITIGGLHGTVAGFKEKGRLVVLKVSKNSDIVVNKSAIAGRLGAVDDHETSAIEG